MQYKYERQKLSDVFNIISGGTPKRSISSYWNGDIPWISIQDFQENSRFIDSTEEFISEEGLNNSSTNILNGKDIIISARGTVGKVNIIRSPMAFNQSCYGLRTKENIDYLFAYYSLINSIRELKSKSYGSVFSTITKRTFDEVDINVFDYGNQLKISNLLGALDSKIEINNRIISNLEKQAQAIFKSWFIDFEPFQDGEFVESELGLIPEGWEIKFIGDICKVSSGKRPLEKTENSGYPIIGANGQTGTNQNYLYNEKVILIGRVGTLGIIQRFNEAIWPSDNTLVFTSDYYEFLHYQLKMIDYSSLNRGSTQPLISQKDIKNIQIVIPSKEIMDSFNGLVSVIFEYIWKLGKESDKLAEIRDTLLPKLMSGEIDVSNISIDAEEECHV